MYDYGIQVSVPFLFLVYLNILSIYANENIDYVYESCIYWWAGTLKNYDFDWLVIKACLILSLGYTMYFVSKFDFRLQSCGSTLSRVIQTVLRAVAIGLILLNLYLGANGGKWWAKWLD